LKITRRPSHLDRTTLPTPSSFSLRSERAPHVRDPDGNVIDFVQYTGSAPQTEK
jgi:hypothetical protein